MQFHRLLAYLCTSILTIGLHLTAYAAPAAIQLKNVAEVEMQSGKGVGRVPAKNVPPDGEVIYTTAFKNISGEPVKNVIIANPIPPNTLYIANSAVGSNTDITYSLNGKNYDIPENLQVPGAHGKGRPAIASDYAYIRWTYKGELASGESGTVSFRVKVR